MGLLDRFRPDTTVDRWRPPPLGTCRCESHVEDLLEERVPRADGAGDVSVADLVTSGALATVPVAEDQLWVEGPGPNERRGPFHWRVMANGGLAPFCAEDAPVALDDAVFIQPGVESVLWLENRAVLAVGAPKLCMRGVQGSVVRALMNPRVRTVQG